MRALAIAFLAVGCGGNVVASAPAPVTDSGWDLGAESTASYCPPVEPAEGTDCPDQRYHSCSYGDSPLPACRRSVWCNVGNPEYGPQWHTQRTGCDDASSGCPATRPVEGAACEMALSRGCAYPDTALCFCAPTDAGNAWSCVVPKPECPRIIPNAGTDCTAPLHCTYGRWIDRWCFWGAMADCTEGHWHWSSPCGDK